MSKGKRKANKQRTKKFVNDLIPPKNIKKIAIQTLENTKTQPNFLPTGLFAPVKFSLLVNAPG